jgi:hypothetical protein
MIETLWAHQLREIEAHAFEPSWFLFWDPRVGKSRAIVGECALWIARANVRRILVVAPKSGCDVWLSDKEFGQFDPRFVHVVDLSTDDTIKERGDTIKRLHRDFPTIIVVNRDVIFKERSAGEDKPALKGLLAALTAWGPEALVLDECHDYRRISSKRARAAEALAKRASFRRGLSGTPDPKDYIDYYSQFKIIAPDVFGTQKSVFVNRYCQMSFLFPNKVENYVNVDELRAKIFSRSSRVRQSECFDMPEVLPDIIEHVSFTKLARELYDELTENLCADFLGLQIDAMHQFSRLAVLHQLAAGYVRNGKEEVEWVFDGKIKAAHAQIEMLLRADKRVVLSHHYKPEGQRLVQECIKKYGKSTVGELNGDTPRSQRSASPFLAKPSMRIFIVQEDTANVSISMREADHMILYSWGPKYDVHYQLRQRIFDDRTAKPHGLSYCYLQVPKSIDVTNRAAYLRKKSASSMILDYGAKRAAYGAV